MLQESSSRLQSRTVRIAVSLFFFICVPLSVWESTVHSKIFALQDPAATAERLLANEFLFRSTLISHVVGTAVFIILAFLFYKLFSPVNKSLARLMVIPILFQFPIVFIMEAVNFTALMTLKGDVRLTFDATQQHELAYFLLRFYRYTFGADKIIFGLFFVPLGVLVFQSGKAPRFIGILFVLGGVGYLADTCLFFLLQRDDYFTIQSLKLFSSATYSLGFLWFLVKGCSRDQFSTIVTIMDSGNCRDD